MRPPVLRALAILFFGIVLTSFSGTASAASWYVDPNATGSNNGTSWANAWTAFAGISWGSIQPGDTIYISGGATSQRYTSPLSIGKSGTSGTPITIAAGQDAGHNGKVIIDGSGGTTTMLNIGSNDWITIDGNYQGAQNILLQNNSSTVESSIVTCNGYSGSLRSGIIIQYVEINAGGDGITCGYTGGSPATAFVLAYSYIHGINFDHAVAVNGSDLASPYNPVYGAGAIFHDNTILVNNAGADNGCGPDGIQGTSGITVYNNVIKGIPGITSQGLTYCGHQDLVQNGGSHYLVYDNFFSGGANSVSESDWGDATCGYARYYNNVMQQSSTQPHSHGIEMAAHSGCKRITDFWVQNNTFVDLWGYYVVRLWIDVSSTTMDNSGITNNIIYNSGQGGAWYIANGTYTCGTGYVIDHNNVNAGSQGGTSGSCNGSTYNGTNGQSGPPAFVSYSEYDLNNNLKLQSSSTPDIGTGLNLSSFFTTDYDGVTRVVPWDLGAYSSNDTSGAPNPPTGLTAVVQ